MTRRDPAVVVVGAGPTGLFLACELALAGIEPARGAHGVTRIPIIRSSSPTARLKVLAPFESRAATDLPLAHRLERLESFALERSMVSEMTNHLARLVRWTAYVVELRGRRQA
jgi:2-polyprenyl-6-methoxyphenol hydroxylase-like FAD-dependent oxidoreductase